MCNPLWSLMKCAILFKDKCDNGEHETVTEDIDTGEE
jgi:hypothetical protein